MRGKNRRNRVNDRGDKTKLRGVFRENRPISKFANVQIHDCVGTSCATSLNLSFLSNRETPENMGEFRIQAFAQLVPQNAWIF